MECGTSHLKACDRGGDDRGHTTRRQCEFLKSYTFIPHCSGTHTECVGHITHDRISIRECLEDVFMRAVLVTVESEIDGKSDRVINSGNLSRVLGDQGEIDALILRTLPNGDWNLRRNTERATYRPISVRMQWT